MPNTEDEHNHAAFFDLRDEPAGSDAICPEFTQSRTAQRLAERVRAIELRHSIVQKNQDSLSARRVKLAEVTVR